MNDVTGFFVELQYLDVHGLECGAFIPVVSFLTASETRNVLKQNAVDTGDGGDNLGKGHLDFLIFDRRRGMPRIARVRTATHITINHVEGFGKVREVLVCASRLMVLEVVDECTISCTIGPLYEADCKRLTSGDGPK